MNSTAHLQKCRATAMACAGTGIESTGLRLVPGPSAVATPVGAATPRKVVS